MQESIEATLSLSADTFENYDHDILITQRPSIWHFEAISRRITKRYAIYCITNLKESTPLIKIALEQINPRTRLVVIASFCEEDDFELADKMDFCLIKKDKLNSYNRSIIRARNIESRNDFLKNLHKNFGKIILKH